MLHSSVQVAVLVCLLAPVSEVGSVKKFPAATRPPVPPSPPPRVVFTRLDDQANRIHTQEMIAPTFTQQGYNPSLSLGNPDFNIQGASGYRPQQPARPQPQRPQQLRPQPQRPQQPRPQPQRPQQPHPQPQRPQQPRPQPQRPQQPRPQPQRPQQPALPQPQRPQQPRPQPQRPQQPTRPQAQQPQRPQVPFSRPVARPPVRLPQKPLIYQTSYHRDSSYPQYYTEQRTATPAPVITN